MDKHTPTPWRVEVGTTLIWGGCNPDDSTTRGMGVPVAKCHVIGVEDGEANAALIVRAVNSHAALTEAVRVLSEALGNVREIAISDHLLDDAEIAKIIAADAAFTQVKELLK